MTWSQGTFQGTIVLVNSIINSRDHGKRIMSIERVNNFGDELRLNIESCCLQLTVPCYC